MLALRRRHKRRPLTVPLPPDPADPRAVVRLETLSEVGRTLMGMAVRRLDEHGPADPRGATLWDIACYVVETMGDGNWRRMRERKS